MPRQIGGPVGPGLPGIGPAIGAADALGTGIGSKIGAGIFDNVWNNLHIGNILLYGGEFLLGLLLIGVGLAKITGADNVLSKAAHATAKAAIL